MIDPKTLARDSLIKTEFLQELKANGMSDNTLEAYHRAVRTLKKIGKDPENLTKKDMLEWSAFLDDKYAKKSCSLYKSCVKRYIRWLHNGENDGGYPKCVKWMKPSGNGRSRLPREILSHDEIKRLTEVAERQRNRALIWTGYESGCRAGELLMMKNKDIDFDRFGAKIHVSGKTGERVIRLVESVPDLRIWLTMNDDNPNAWLWPSSREGRLSEGGFYYVLQKCAERAGIEKHVYPHLLRHSRATHLTAQGLNEAQLREIFGWSKSSDMPSVYVHLSGRDTDDSILKLYGFKVESAENQLEMSVKKCSFCSHENSPNAKFCSECNAPLDVISAEMSDKKFREQDELTRKIVERLIERAPEVVEQVLSEEDVKRELSKQSEVAVV